MEMKVIAAKNLPAKLPIITTLGCLISMDHFHIAQWGVGIIYFLLVLQWIFSIYKMIIQKDVDVFNAFKGK